MCQWDDEDEEEKLDGVYCDRDENRHFTCNTCLCVYIPLQYKSRDLRVKFCRSKKFTCCITQHDNLLRQDCTGGYNTQEIARLLGNDNTKDQTGDRTPCAKAHGEINAGFDELCGDDQKEEVEQQNVEERIRRNEQQERDERLKKFTPYERSIINKISKIYNSLPDLILKCPKCESPFSDWSGCSALECKFGTCGDRRDHRVSTKFCAFCAHISPNNTTNHAHVSGCHYNSSGSYHPSYRETINGRARYLTDKLSDWLKKPTHNKILSSALISILRKEAIERVRTYPPHVHDFDQPCPISPQIQELEDNKNELPWDLKNIHISRLLMTGIDRCFPSNWYDFINYQYLKRNILMVSEPTRKLVNSIVEIWMRWIGAGTAHHTHLLTTYKKGLFEPDKVLCSVCYDEKSYYDFYIGCTQCNYYECNDCAYKGGELQRLLLHSTCANKCIDLSYKPLIFILENMKDLFEYIQKEGIKGIDFPSDVENADDNNTEGGIYPLYLTFLNELGKNTTLEWVNIPQFTPIMMNDERQSLKEIVENHPSLRNITFYQYDKTELHSWGDELSYVEGEWKWMSTDEAAEAGSHQALFANYTESRDTTFLKKAAEAGNKRAQFYCFRLFGEQFYEEMIKRASEQCYMPVKQALAERYFERENYTEAILLYKEVVDYISLERELIDVYEKLSMCYEKIGEYAEAIYYLRKSIRSGTTSVLHNIDIFKYRLAKLLYDTATDDDLLEQAGFDIDDKEVKDQLTEAFSLFESVKDKVISSSYYLGLCYLNGHGTRKDNKSAFDYFSTTVLSLVGNEPRVKGENRNLAAYYLGIFYYYPDKYPVLGVVQNYTLAYEYFKIAADGDIPQAYRMLGKMYKDGKGVVGNLDKAKKWSDKFEAWKKENEW
jgi:TPR repeat protein